MRGVKSNSFLSLRLVFALLEVVSHSADTSGHYFNFSFGSIGIGSLAVFGFFSLSGYLVTPGLIRDGVFRYFIRRTVRIFPAYWVSSLVTLLVFGRTWGKWAHQQIGFPVCLNYLLHNILFFPASAKSPYAGWNLLQGLPEAVPNEHVVNASIWSLPLEFLCYAILAMLFMIKIKSKNMPFEKILYIVLAIFWISSIVLATRISHFWLVHPSIITNVGAKWPYLLAFIFGAVCALRNDHFASDFYKFKIPGLLVISYFAAQTTVGWAIIGSVTFTLAVIMIGYSNLLRLNFMKTDISFGIYLYHWPIQQTLVHFFPLKSDRVLFIALSILISSAFAYASAKMIEEPTINWGKKFSENFKSF